MSLSYQLPTPTSSLYDMFFTRLVDLACVVGYDGLIRRANPSFEQVTGYTEADLIGKPFADFIHPEEHQQHQQHMNTVTEGRAINLYDERFRCKDGSYQWLGWSATPIPEQAIYLGVAHEITARKQVEIRTEEQQRLLDQITSAVPDIVYLYDLHAGANVYANRSLFTVLGYTDEQILNVKNGVLDLMHPDDVEAVSAHMQVLAHAEDSKVYEQTYRIRHANGSWRWLHSRDMVFERDEQGGVSMLLGIGQDVTTQQQTQAELARKTHFLESVLKAIPELVYITDASGQKNLFESRPLAAVLGYTQAEFAAMDGFDTASIVHPDDLPLLATIPDELAAASAAVADRKIRIRAADGSWRWFRTRTTVFERDAQGKPLTLIGFNSNIDIIKQHEDRLRDSEELVRQVAEAINGALWMADVEDGGYRMLYYNNGMPASIGFTHEQFMTDRPLIMEHVLPEYREQLTKTFFNRENKIQQLDFEFINPNQEKLWLRLRNFPITDASGKVVRIVSLQEDITERKTASENLRRAQAEQERVRLTHKFISDASHDFRTPISIIKANAYLSRKHTDEEKRIHAILEIEGQADHITVMLDDMLTLLRLDQLEGNKEIVFDLADMVRHAVTSQISTSTRHNHRLTVEAEQPLMISGRPQEIRTALLNLFHNAINYTADGGVITVRTFQRGEYAFIEVEDNGIGIAPESQDAIFESFYRADNARQTDKGGTGLGLAIVRKVVELHRGSISVKSTPGIGSVFTIELPLIS